MSFTVNNIREQNTLPPISANSSKCDIPSGKKSFHSQLEAYLDTTPSSIRSDNTVRDAIKRNAAIDINRSLDIAKDKTLAVKESDWIDLKPEEYSIETFRGKIAYANYAQSLLDPEVLPRWVSKPEEGISRSTDMIAPPSFEKTTGGVYRIDHTMSGKVQTYIPSYQWRKTGTTKDDTALGDVYNQQMPWGFRTAFIRDGSRRTPIGYQEGAYEKEISTFLNSKQYTPKKNITSDKYTNPPAELNWQERLVFYNNPAQYLLNYLASS